MADQKSFSPGEGYDAYRKVERQALVALKDWVWLMLLTLALMIGWLVWAHTQGLHTLLPRIMFGALLFVIAASFSLTAPGFYFDLGIRASTLTREQLMYTIHLYRWYPALCTATVLVYLVVGVSFLVFLGQIVPH